MHPGYVPVEVKQQEDGRLILIIADKDGNQIEIKDNDQVSAPAELSCGFLLTSEPDG